MELERRDRVDMLEDKEMVLLGFDDTLCIHSSRDREASKEEDWQNIINGKSPWPHASKSRHMQEFIHACCRRNIKMRLISCAGSYPEMVGKQEWVASQYNVEMDNYCVSSRGDKVIMAKAIATVENLSSSAVMVVDDNVDTIMECAEAGFKAYSPMEIVEYIEGTRKLASMGSGSPDCAEHNKWQESLAGRLGKQAYAGIHESGSCMECADVGSDGNAPDDGRVRGDESAAADAGQARDRGAVRGRGMDAVLKANIVVLSNAGYRPKQICEILGIDYEKHKGRINSLKQAVWGVDLGCADIDLEAVRAAYACECEQQDVRSMPDISDGDAALSREDVQKIVGSGDECGNCGKDTSAPVKLTTRTMIMLSKG